MMSTANICNSPITEDYLQRALKDSLGPKAILRSMSAEQIAKGHGFISTILRVRLEWETPDPDLPETVVVKVPVVDTVNAALGKLSIEEEKWKTRQKVVDFIQAFHERECGLYEVFRECAPIPVPVCYASVPGGVDSPGMLIMEDLSTTASILPSLCKGLTLPQIINATTEMARLHAWSLTTSVDWKSRVKDMEEFRASFEPMLLALHPGYEAIKRQYPDHFGSIDSKKMCAFMTFENYLAYSYDHRMFMEDVLVHGDLWANNIMYEKMADGSVGDKVIAFVDWQITARGSPMADLARVLSWSVCPKLRRQHTDRLINHYYRNLKSRAGDKVTASIEQLRYCYQRHFAFNVLWILTGLRMFAEKFARGEGEEQLQEQRDFVDRMKANYEDALVIVENCSKYPPRYEMAEFREK